MTTPTQLTRFPHKLIAKGFNYQTGLLDTIKTKFPGFNKEWVNMNGIYTIAPPQRLHTIVVGAWTSDSALEKELLLKHIGDADKQLIARAEQQYESTREADQTVRAAAKIKLNKLLKTIIEKIDINILIKIMYQMISVLYVKEGVENSPYLHVGANQLMMTQPFSEGQALEWKTNPAFFPQAIFKPEEFFILNASFKYPTQDRFKKDNQTWEREGVPSCGGGTSQATVAANNPFKIESCFITDASVEMEDEGLSTGALVGIIAGSVVGVALLVAIIVHFSPTLFARAARGGRSRGGQRVGIRRK